LKDNSQCVTLTHYTNDRFPNVDGLIPPTVLKYPTGDIEKKRRNASVCSFWENLEAEPIMSHPKLTKPSISVQSTEISSEPKYDMNATQHISTRRSKKLHELISKLSKYTPRSAQLLEGGDDFSLPINLHSRYQTCYSNALYGAWPYSLPMPDVGIELSFCCNDFVISKSNIDAANLGLFILSHVLIPPKQSIALMPFWSPIYCRLDYLNIIKYKHIICMYSMCMNGYVSKPFNIKNLLYIDARLCTDGSIVGFMNSSRCSLFSANCSFEEHFNDHEFFMKRKASIFFVAHAIHSLSRSDDLLIKYNFRRPPTTRERHLALGLPLNIPLGCKTKKVISYIW